MDPQRWTRVKELFHAALARPASERAAFLSRACEGDEALRETVASMLALEPASLDFLESPALEVQAIAVAGELARRPSSAAAPGAPVPPLPSNLPLLRGAARATRLPVRARPPWWMLLLAVVLLGDGVLRAWCWIAGPEGFGLTCEVQDGRQVVSRVAAGGLADESGIRRGDVIVRVDGRPYPALSSPFATRPNMEVGRTYRLDIERNGQRLAAALTMRRVRILDEEESRWEARVLWHAASLVMLATALLIAFRRPHDTVARVGALTLASLSISFYLVNLPPGYAAAWRALPFGTGALLLIPNLAVALVGPIGVTFFALFPKPLFRSRWPWLVVWLPALYLAPAFLYTTLATVYWPGQALGTTGGWLRPMQPAAFAVYGMGMLAAIVANYHRLTGVHEKRRLRLLVAGGAVATLPALVRLGIMGLATPSPLVTYLFSGWRDLLVASVFLLFPLTFAYAILKHRLLGVRVIIRRGVQYMLARGVVISLVPLLALALAADALLHGDRPFIDIVTARGWAYAIVGVLAVLVHSQRRRMANAVDRHFFREHYDASQLLRDVAEEARRTGSLEAAAPGIVARIQAALQPTFAALFVRAAGETVFRAIASSPSGGGPAAIEETSGLAAALRAGGTPARVSGTASPYSSLDDFDRSESDAVELAVPIEVSGAAVDALLALGPKRSEEPYREEDRDSLAAIAASLSLLLQRPGRGPEPPPSVFDECPACGECYDTGAERCTREQAVLVQVGMPRTLASRYRLERRLRRGGMGMVYEATDSALQRHVAVKVIRDEWVYSASAAERFRREARSVAGLDHPNVVTIHDYGVEAGRRAFLVMELLQGETLGDELRRSRRLGAARTIEVFRGVCSGVEAAHARRILHRDLKPENIFLLRQDAGAKAVVKVLDFGVAKPLGGNPDEGEPAAAETDIGVLVGTVGYMSPEQLLGEPPDVSWDIWALAIVAYQCLAGALPFPTASRESWRRLVLGGRPTLLAAHLSDAPPRWQDFFDACLALDRVRRPPSAADFLRELEQALTP